MLASLFAAFRIPDLRKRILFVFGMFAVYVVGLHIPIPGVDRSIMERLVSSGGALGLLDMFTGGAFKRFTIFAMGITPYINASIIMQLLTIAIPELEKLAKEGESGRKKIGQYTRYLTGILAFVQAIGMDVMLNQMGAKISGVGSNLLTINGVEHLSGCDHTLLPDMIEIGSFIGLAAMTHSELTIKNVSFQSLGIIPSVFRKIGIGFSLRNDDIIVPAQDHYQVDTFIDGSILTIDDAPWPGFTPDLLSVILVVATQARGSVLIHQKMFESRLFFVDKLIDMGAQIILCDPHRATVIGLDNQIRLRPTVMTSPDIRAGVALLIAAMSANGTSIIHNIEQIDRGYERIDERLNALGAEITRL